MNGFFKGKVYGTAMVGGRGQLVIPASLRKDLSIKAGDRLMIFAKIDRKMISIMREKDFSNFLQKASKIISKLENKVSKED
ncbi:MAG: AbrB/MazE/SpoVT family DNA-binding domain-containing protein [Candidatus Omnitrophica bacterium]|nr:AbrB/MazE/SpoVT family DNA-binding domain-containing protein [Candidatus Omnitrophota bacterium]